MKVKPQLLAGILAAALAMGSSMSVYAAESVTAVPDTKHNDSYEVSNIKNMQDYEDLKTQKPFVIGAIEDVNNGTDKSTEKFLQKILQDENEKTVDSVKAIQDTIKNSEFLSDFFDIHVKGNEMASSDFLRENADVEKTKDGAFKVTLSVPALTQNNKKPYVLHYSKDTGVWEILWPTNVDYKNKTMTIEFKNFSPAAVLALAATNEETPTPPAIAPDEEEKNPASDEKITDDDDDDDDGEKSSSSGSKSSSKSSSKSPKTGVTETWALWFAASAVLAGVAARKRH
ncbi:MAG: hypothetical protein Q4F43_09730 [Eubacteriales bacterium]|nr:hypothetical protein [Eubacteriales bacterium]